MNAMREDGRGSIARGNPTLILTMRRGKATPRPSSIAGKNRRRTSTCTLLRWIAVFVTVVVVRMIWNSAVVTSRSVTFIGDLDVPRYVFPSTITSLIDPSSSASSRIKRPPKQSSRQSLEATYLVGASLAEKQDQIRVLPGLQSKGKLSWRSLCDGDENSRQSLSPKSRVFLSGILTHTVAVELALALKKQCHVETIVGLSTSAPDKTEIPPRVAYLLRRLPNFKWIHMDALISQQRLDDLVISTRPTHVVHFEASTLLPSHILADTPSIFVVREGLEMLDRIGRALITWQSKEKRGGNPVRVLYVTTPSDQHESYYRSHAVELAYPLLLQTFRAHYYLDAMQLELPAIYGPFTESALPADSLLPFLPGSGTTGTALSSAPLVHIDDCVMTIVASLSTSKVKSSELPHIHTPPIYRTSANDIAQAFQKHLDDDAYKLTNDRTRLMLSWLHQSVYPFDDTSNVYSNVTKSFFRKTIAMTNRRLSLDKTEGISLLQRRQQSLFPCASECAVNSPCQEASALTPLIPISQNITRECRFVLLTSDFSASLEELPVVKESIRIEFPWPKHLLCQVAFVSGKSPLIQSLLARERIDEQGLDEKFLNGQLEHGQWTLLWLPENDESNLSEADALLPKLAPRPFFSRNVTKSIFIEPRRKLDNFPPLPVVWFLLAKQLDAKKQAERVKNMRRSGTSVNVPTILPAVPARHVALFTHALGLPHSKIQSNSIVVIAKFLLKLRGVSMEDHESPTRQIEYYDFAKTQYDMAFVDTFLLIHNLESDRSRRLRCDWYEEHLFWSDDETKSNRRLEDLSLAHVLARWRSEQRLISNDDYHEEWGERIVETAKGDLLDLSHSSEFLPSQYFVKLHTRAGKEGD